MLKREITQGISLFYVLYLFQLDPLSASVCSTPSTSMNVTINPLSPSVPSGARSLNATLGANVPLSADSTPHTPAVDVPDSVESNIILPTSSILQEAALILPEKVIHSLHS